MYTEKFPDEFVENYRFAVQKAREDRPRYFAWIKKEIEIAISLINNFDKIYVLGGLGSKLIKSTPNAYNQFLETYTDSNREEVEKEFVQSDDQIEILLEYLMSISTASPNSKKGIIPTQEDIEEIYEQLSKIKSNINFWELSAENPANGDEFDHWLRTTMMLDTINVRGEGYFTHIQEVYQEMFHPFDGFLQQYYGFNSKDIFSTILKLDSLVYSKVGNPLGTKEAQKRLTEWMQEVGKEKIDEVMREQGKHFIIQFTEANPDLYDPETPEHILIHSLENVKSYNKIFWVIPQTQKEELIFERLSIEFGANDIFFLPPTYKGFPLNDTLINLKPLIKEDYKYYDFSLNLAYRNIFKITEELIKSADAVYYDNSFKGNSNSNSRDNYIELKTKQLFEKLVPTAKFYHSLEYSIIEDGVQKRTELDILGVSEDSVYIIEVKAGLLNTKHRRGALKGLKDRLKETINEGSYQCHRALKYIQENDSSSFEYIEAGTRKTLSIDNSQIRSYFKISVTFEHFSSIAANLKYLVNSGVLSSDFQWTWIVSLYDLMVFSDLIQNENEFKEYLTNRMELYDRNDIEFSDEIDILGYYLENNFPLRQEKENEIYRIVNFKEEIDSYYTGTELGIPAVNKPKKK
ncbi:hypothetical protein [Emticicia sp. 17c]|uniref:hypothetical protein n=1 Tax=Emticicia sp. 17c TaxID=3127704 RepID=UPI00301DEB57